MPRLHLYHVNGEALGREIDGRRGRRQIQPVFLFL
jgi:hypothetical protein